MSSGRSRARRPIGAQHATASQARGRAFSRWRGVGLGLLLMVAIEMVVVSEFFY